MIDDILIKTVVYFDANLKILIIFPNSIYHPNRDVADVIIGCDRWMEAMQHSFVSPVTGQRETPIRLLIKHFPDLAKKVRRYKFSLLH